MSATIKSHALFDEAARLVAVLQEIGVNLTIRPDGSVSFRTPAPIAESTLADMRRLRSEIAEVLKTRSEPAPAHASPTPASWIDTKVGERCAPSWADPTNEPQPGDQCRCCRRAAWWTEARERRGWRSMTCHPPAGLDPAAVRIVRFGVGVAGAA